MSKKPLVPVKRPTKGRGKGNCRGLKKLMKEVDSIAKGLKEVKGFNGGGWFSKGTNNDVKEVVAKDYYDKLRDFFTKPENIANIKRLKEGLVNDVLKTMASGLDDIVDINTTDDVNNANKVEEIVNFVSIISGINNLKQGNLDKVINSGNLNGLPYIYKISTLVMINMLIDVYKSQNKEPQIEGEITFTFLDNTKVLISRIIDEYKGGKSKDVLKSLTAEVKRELKYYKEIYRLRDYVYIKGKGDDTDVEKIIEELKGICKGVEENDFKKFITSSNINSTDFTTGCDDDKLKTQIGKVNEIIKKMKGQYQTKTPYIDELKVNPLYILLLIDNRDTKGLLSLPDLTLNLYDLYNSITTYENIMMLFKNMKEEYIECVKPFFDGYLLADYELKEELTPDKKKPLEKFLKENEIINLENEITRIRETRDAIIKLQENKTGKFYNDIPFDMKQIIELFNTLCSANTSYYIYMVDKNIKEEKYKVTAAKQENEIKEGVENSLQGMLGNAVKKARELKEIKAQQKNNKVNVVAPPTAPPTAPAPTPFRNLPNPFKDKEETLDEYHRDRTTANELGGGKLTTKYISTGNFVYILYEKKKIKRCIYAKAKGRGKYCKIKGDYMLLSKLKVV